MSNTYALGSPWWLAGWRCGPEQRRPFDDWLGSMTGRRTGRAGQHAGWGMFGGGAPLPPPWVGGGPPWPAPRARRGDVRAAILGVLAEQSMNGYQVIQEIAERSEGAWKPSPGSIYPTLQQLEDEGLVYGQEESGRRTFALTDEGRTYVAEHPDELSSPWATAQPRGDEAGFKSLVGQVAAALWQVMAVGSASQQARGREAVIELRRKLHAILAEDDDESGAS